MSEEMKWEEIFQRLKPEIDSLKISYSWSDTESSYAEEVASFVSAIRWKRYELEDIIKEIEEQ